MDRHLPHWIQPNTSLGLHDLRIPRQLFTSLRLSVRLIFLFFGICRDILFMSVIENNLDRLCPRMTFLGHDGFLLFRIGKVGSLEDLVCSL